jgi:hypothetical protein
MHYFADFFAGAFLCNCIPHLVCGLQGAPFPSPFASPPGQGDSPPLVNVLWGLFNLLAGGVLWYFFPVVAGPNAGCAALLLGVTLMGVFLALHFGRVQASKRAGRPL